MKKAIVCMLAAIAALFIAEPSKGQTTGGTDSLKTITLKVKNLHCNNDMPTIKKRLLNQDGIDEVVFTDISGETSVFTISYHTSVTSQQQIEKAIESTPGCDNKNETPYRVKRKK
jgi:copper chaperone CopZ